MSLRVLHLSTYATNGGAGRAATALDLALQAAGVESRLKTAHGMHFEISRRLDRTLWRLQSSPIRTWRSPARFGSLSATEINSSSADVVNLHWITDGYLSIEEIGKITKPIVWSLYDMWPFCGTEHYGVNTDSARWRTGYSKDNRPEDESGWDIDRWAWQRKKINWSPMTIVAASRWLGQSVQDSELMGAWPVTRIPHVVDTDLFSPMDKQQARQKLALPETSPLILFLASAGIADERKGFDLLEEALVAIHATQPEAHVVVAGPASTDYTSPSGIPIIWFGNVKGDTDLRTLYCAADLLVVPSREDNMPLTAMEAQSCGVPVVAFDIGGLPDIVKTGETGILVELSNVEQLSSAISRLLENRQLQQSLGASARQHALDTWSPSVIARAYQQLYEDLVS